ncbi:MAG: YraN family protein [Salibacteraceae bacterium]
MAEHNDTGQAGENLAAEYLQKKGYKILERNWRFGKEEVDIIALHEGMLVIAEVKCRTSEYFGQPHEAVSKGKQNHLIKAANAYIEKNDLDLECRFDIIGVVINRNGRKITHVEGAFQPRW